MKVTLHRVEDEHGNVSYNIVHGDNRCTLEEFTQFIIPVPINRQIDITIENALTHVGVGMIANSAEELRRLVTNTSMKILRRVLSYISGCHHRIEFNEIGRDGGGTHQAVTFDDIDAFQFLLKVSLIYPLALRKESHSFIRFEVPLEPLLWTIRDFIASVVNQNLTFDSIDWNDIWDRRERIPWRHQIDTYNEMVQINRSGKRGNFLWIPVGLGKTMIIMMYLQYLKSINKLPPYVIYTLPDSAIQTIQNEVLSFGFRVENLNPTQTVRTPQLELFTKRGCIPSPYTISLIEHDHLRICRDTFTEIMPYSIFIVDEVHKTLNDTLRTSAALELSNLSQDFVVMTGTPVIDTKIYKLTNWISCISDFEVNNDNFWVAINSIISKKVNTGVIVLREEVEATFTTEERHLYHSLVSPSMGGTNTASTANDFNKAIDICYDAANREMINQITQQFTNGNGVMLVARNLEHQQQLYNILLSKGFAQNDIFLIKRGQSIFLTDETISQRLVPNYRIVITPINYSTGYTLTRFHVMISSIYPSNGAVREQLEGRINRIGQHSRTVTHIYVHVGILTHIMRNHQDVKNLSEVLRTLAQEIKL